MATKKKKRPADINSLAASIVAEAIGDEAPEVVNEGEPEKDPAAVALGRKGGLKGGKARAAKLSKRKRSEIASAAAKKRWGKG
jgi:predicted KAP-like P-loop ATPase